MAGGLAPTIARATLAGSAIIAHPEMAVTIVTMSTAVLASVGKAAPRHPAEEPEQDQDHHNSDDLYWAYRKVDLGFHGSHS